MHPILVRVAGFTLRSEGALYGLAIIIAGLFASHAARRRGWNAHDVLPGLALVVPAAYIGARALGALVAWAPADSISELLKPGALSFYGGVALGIPVLLAYLRWQRLPVGEVADALVPLGPLLYMVFRLGCLLNGDDYGRPTSMPWGMSFPHGSPPISQRVHPTQIYEILLTAPILVWVLRRSKRGLPVGALTFELCILMGIERFVVEFWRMGDTGPEPLTLAQWLSIALLTVGGMGLFLVRRGPSERASAREAK